MVGPWFNSFEYASQHYHYIAKPFLRYNSILSRNKIYFNMKKKKKYWCVVSARPDITCVGSNSNTGLRLLEQLGVYRYVYLWKFEARAYDHLKGMGIWLKVLHFKYSDVMPCVRPINICENICQFWQPVNMSNLFVILCLYMYDWTQLCVVSYTGWYAYDNFLVHTVKKIVLFGLSCTPTKIEANLQLLQENLLNQKYV